MPLIKFMIEDFLEHREYEMNVSESTLKTYKVHLNEFQKYCTEQEKITNIEDIKPITMKSYFRYVTRTLKNGAESYNTKRKNLKAFFNYLINEEVIDESPMVKIEKKKTDIKIEVFSDNHIRQMLRYYRRLRAKDKTIYAYRDYTIILVLLGTGIRLGELCELKWSNIDLKNSNMTVFGKRRMQQSVPLVADLITVLSEWMVYCENEFGELSEYVFVTRENKQLTVNGVKCIFKRLKKEMNFKDVRLSPHTFRHTFAHRYLMNGGDVFSLKQLMRHADLKTTEKYLAVWGTALKEQNNKFNPLNNMNA